jgi:hypothetical protein
MSLHIFSVLSKFNTSFISDAAVVLSVRLTENSGIGLETCILFAKEGANVLMADISAPALQKASAKLRQLVPSAHIVEIQVILLNAMLLPH